MDDATPEETDAPNAGGLSSNETDPQGIITRRRIPVGLLIVTLIACVLIVSAGPLVILVDEIDLGENVTVVLQLSAFIPGFVSIGYAGVVPMLLFRRPLTRLIGALVGQICGFAIYITGCFLVEDLTMSLREWITLGGSLFLVCALGGFLPTACLIWFRRWALVAKGHQPHTPQMGIVDLMALSAAGAGFLAFQKEYGLFSAEFADDMDVSIITVVAFYSAIGMAVTSSLLVAMRISLVERGERLNSGTMIGTVFTLVLVFGFWAALIMLDGPMTDWHPAVQWFLNGTSSWLTAGLSAAGICFGLRCAGYRLSTVRTARSSNKPGSPRTAT